MCNSFESSDTYFFNKSDFLQDSIMKELILKVKIGKVHDPIRLFLYIQDTLGEDPKKLKERLERNGLDESAYCKEFINLLDLPQEKKDISEKEIAHIGDVIRSYSSLS
jgi:hypothetical protein